jgi:hypothetical protein
MTSDKLEKLCARWLDQYVAVDASVPTLGRFAGMVGQVKMINQSGRALVQFVGSDSSRYDIDPAHLTITAPPPPPEPPKKPEPAKPKAEA